MLQVYGPVALFWNHSLIRSTTKAMPVDMRHSKAHNVSPCMHADNAANKLMARELGMFDPLVEMLRAAVADKEKGAVPVGAAAPVELAERQV